MLALLEKHGLPESAVEMQKLSGMADQLRAAVAQRGLRIREYVPVGEMIPGMAYFVRRLLENTSNQSWLRAGFSDEVSDDVLLASPHVAADGRVERQRQSRGTADVVLNPQPESLQRGQAARADAGRRRARRRAADAQRAAARFLAGGRRASNSPRRSPR